MILEKESKANRIVAANLAELYCRAAERYDGLPVFATRRHALDWEPVSFRELYEQGLDLAAGLIDLGVAAREHVGLFSDNRFEWILADYGVQLCGAADVPRGCDTSDAELMQIIRHAGIQVAFVETEAVQARILARRQELPGLREIILLDPAGRPQAGGHRLRDVCERGARRRAKDGGGVAARIAGIRPDDLFTLIYTSGTTGEPKGVMLTHANVMSQIRTLPAQHTCTDRVLSVLPVWHIFERIMEMYSISCGACTYYSGIRTLAGDMQNVEPTFMASAPRLWETLHQRILQTIDRSHPMRRLLFRIAYGLARAYRGSLDYLRNRNLQTRPQSVRQRALFSVGHALRWLGVLPWYGFFNVAVLERVRRSVGGSLNMTISGGGALPVEIDRFFNTIGIPILEGYGLTETSPVLAVRVPSHPVIGTVGPPLPETEIRVVNPATGKVVYPHHLHPGGGRGRKGEIWARGPQVMKGYYRQPEATARALRDGWLRTGDLGMITHNDCLKILGRCKATIVLSNGENIEPEAIEMRLRQSPYIDQCALVGQDEKYPGALIVPALEAFQAAGIPAGSLEELARTPAARRIIRVEIRNLVSTTHGFKPYECIRVFRLLAHPFSVGNELTSLFKIKRHVIEKRYETTIREMFAPRANGTE